MSRKIIAFWSTVLLLVAFSQCNQCKTSFVEDLTQCKLVWDKAAALGSSPSWGKVAKGIICHVPSEDAVYFLEPAGECSKFTQTSAGGLTCERVASFSGTTTGESLVAFPAGSSQSQALHVGIVNNQNLTLQKYEGRGWKEVCSIAMYAPNKILRNLKGSACSVTNHEKAQLDGLIVLVDKSANYGGVFCYDARQEKLEPSSTWLYGGSSVVDTLTEIAPGAMLLSENSSYTQFLSYWTEKTKQYDRVQGQMPGFVDRASLFLLHAKGLMSRAFFACFVQETGKTKLQFYTVPHAHPHTMQPIDTLPEVLEENDKPGTDNRIDHAEDLLLPFSEVVYVVTKDKDDQPIYYKGSIQEPKK